MFKKEKQQHYYKNKTKKTAAYFPLASHSTVHTRVEE